MVTRWEAEDWARVLEAEISRVENMLLELEKGISETATHLSDMRAVRRDLKQRLSFLVRL